MAAMVVVGMDVMLVVVILMVMLLAFLCVHMLLGTFPVLLMAVIMLTVLVFIMTMRMAGAVMRMLLMGMPILGALRGQMHRHVSDTGYGIPLRLLSKLQSYCCGRCMPGSLWPCHQVRAVCSRCQLHISEKLRAFMANLTWKLCSRICSRVHAQPGRSNGRAAYFQFSVGFTRARGEGHASPF